MEPIAIAVLFGLAVAVVLLTSLIKNTGWDHRAKTLVATLLSVVTASAAVWFGVGGVEFEATELFLAITSLYGLSQLLYNFILRGTSVDATLTNVGTHDEVP